MSPARCVIPSVELQGDRAHKLQQIDALIASLELRRRALAGVTLDNAIYEGPSRHGADVEWPWFVAGLALALAFVVLLLLARSVS